MKGVNEIIIQDWLNYIRSFREYLEHRAIRMEIKISALVGFGIYCLYISITTNNLILQVFCYIGIIISWSWSYLIYRILMRYILCLTKYLNLEIYILSGKLKDVSKLGLIVPGIFNLIMGKKYWEISEEFFGKKKFLL